MSHDYLSTACLHGHHDYCASAHGQLGPKMPASCKFCRAPCRCSCHHSAQEMRAAGKDMYSDRGRVIHRS